MSADFIKKWVAALRSGEYKQGFGRLCTEIDGQRSYCCLGVAAELFYGPETWTPTPTLGVLRPKDQGPNWFDPPGVSSDDASDFAMMNDDGKSFDEIADYIEEKYLCQS